jgi:hypothetical protein
MSRPQPAFELMSREGCHLCDEMEVVLGEVLPAHGLAWTVVDVDTDEGLRELYGDVVPVLLRDGRPVAKVRVSARQLERIVRRRR